MTHSIAAAERAALRQTLVKAGRGERVPPERRAKILAIGAGIVGGALASTASAAPVASATATASAQVAASSATASLATWKILVVAGGLLVSTGAAAIAVVASAYSSAPAEEDKRDKRDNSRPGLVPSVAPSSPMPLPAPSETAATSVRDLPSVPEVSGAPVVAPARAGVRPAPSTSARASDSLTMLPEQLASVETIRTAMREGRTADALRLLDAHEARFPGGALAEEIETLRIEACARGGDRARAKRLAERFITERPTSPYAPRVKAMLSQLE
jgi:hypothetical protein